VPYSVHVIELRSAVLENRAFAGKNADRREDKRCLYVGQTARTPEERLAQHLGGVRSSRIVREYGVRQRAETPHGLMALGDLSDRAEEMAPLDPDASLRDRASTTVCPRLPEHG
jgi:hypothetical protein